MDGGAMPTTHDELLALAKEAAGQVSAWQARLVEVTAALMETSCADPWPVYLGWALGMTPSEAREVVELVDRLDELPATRALLAEGGRSLRSVLAIARRATPDTEAAILESAGALTGAQLERALREYGRVVAPSRRDDAGGSAEDDADLDPDPSTAQWGWRDGRFRARLDFDLVDGAALEAWLEAERGRVLAAVDGESALQHPADRTRAEAVLSLGERAMGTAANDVGFLPDAVTVNVVVHATETADGRVRIDRSFVPGVGPVPEWTLAMLMERGRLVATVMVDGEPVMATQPVRFATAEQRRQLLARDGGCTYPGCGATRRLIAHHIRYFDDGGPTQLRNLVLVCRRHHRVVHRHELRITPEPDAPPGRFRWRFATARGEPLSHRHPGPGPAARRRRPTGQRQTGTGERLHPWALDVALAHWRNAAGRERPGAPAEREPAAA